MSEVYDHSRKGGNEGDIRKHPALIAALDQTVAHTGHSPFKYADIFTGHAKNPLRKGCEWPQGIGLVAHVFSTAADPHDSEIHNADFVFIDPPDKSHWTRISELIGCLDRERGVLVWLPVGADTTETPPVEDRVSRQCRCEALNLGMGISTIRWAKGGHTIGCQLLYRVNANARCALRKAVEEIVHLAQLSGPVSPKWRYPVVHY